MMGQENLNSFRKDKNMYIFRHRDYFWNKPLNQTTRDLSKEIGKYINTISDLPIEHGFTFNEQKQVVFNQVNCYPNNGFMYKHKDTKKNELIINTSFPITFKNQHYFDGGLFIKKDKTMIDIDSKMKPASIVFYNGNLKHEIMPIKAKNSIGRIVGYSMKQYFLSKSDQPKYIKLLIQADIAIRKRLRFKNIPNQGNVINNQFKFKKLNN